MGRGDADESTEPREGVALGLSDSREAFETLARISPDAIFTADTSSTILFVNEAAERIFGYPREAMLGRKLSMLMPEYLRHAPEEAMARHAASGERNASWESIEFTGMHESGAEIPLEVSFAEFASEGHTLFTGIVRDTTNRKKSEGALQRLASFPEQDPDPIVELRRDGRLTYLNPAAESRFPDLRGAGTAHPFLAGLRELGATMRSGRDSHLRREVSVGDAVFDQSVARVPGRNLLQVHGRDVTAHKRAERRLRDQLDFTSALAENLAEGVFALDVHGRVTFWNPAAEAMLGIAEEEILGKKVHDVIHYIRPDGTPFPEHECPLVGVSRTGTALHAYEETFLRRDGSFLPVLCSSSPIRTGEHVVGAVLAFRDTSKRKRAERRAEAEAQLLEMIARAAPVEETLEALARAVEDQAPGLRCSILLLEPGGTQLRHAAAPTLPEAYVRAIDGVEIGPAVGACGTAAFLGETVLSVDIASDPAWVAYGDVALAHGLRACWSTPIRSSTGTVLGTFALYPDGARAPNPTELELVAFSIHLAGIAIERHVADEALRASEGQLRQSQRMEAVGRLAGGVAHDFNNLLTVIAGYSNFLLRGLSPNDPLREHAFEIQSAADRAARLTRQLLAFSRKQLLQPRVLDLNVAVSGLGRMLARLIGEDIDLRLLVAREPVYVSADPGQLEQVIVNLAVNARDAMPEGGVLTIETGAIHLDDSYTRVHGYVVPGNYAFLTVSDTGVGMDDDTRAHIFEPFFTTKDVDKGTGLGLSTVYGIVKQSGGSIEAESAPGRGAKFTVFVPEVAPEAFTQRSDTVGPTTGAETVLLAEDEPGVRRLAAESLRREGYTVIEAASGGDAIALFESYEGRVDLLITDVVMPRMSGKILAEHLTAASPNLRVLYMSGYTDDAIGRHGVLEQGMSFIGKPFAPESLARKVREVLDGKPT